jgi:8-oxo-dGTP pyrophosphatase MutT (NUDIX family)
MEVQDASPLERAYKELREETGFTENDLTLIRSVQPQVVVDQTIDTRWTIYPFLFQLNSPDLERRMRINWEHTEFRWIHPMQLSTYQIVPALEETLHRVLQ